MYKIRSKLAKKPVDYFLSESGRKTSFYAITATGLGILCATFLPKTIFTDEYREYLLQLHSENNDPVEVPDTILKRIEIAKEKSELTDFEKRYTKPFIVAGHDAIDIGSTKSKYCAWIGIPIHYAYNNKADIEKQNFEVNNSPIDWDSEQGKCLEEALILKEDEQIFGFCRSILGMQSFKVLDETLYPTITFVGICYAGARINQKWNLYAAPRAARLGMYSLLGFFGLGFYALITDATNVYRERSIDAKLASLGPEMCDAGVRYHEKLLNKNKTLVALGVSDSYTSDGNNYYYGRNKTEPITNRLDFFKSMLKEYQKAKDESVVTSEESL